MLSLLLMGLFTALLLPSAGAEDAPGPRLVILIVPGLRAEDLSRPELPALQATLREGASGWMDCRAARAPGFHPLRPIERPSTSALLLTLGTGMPAYVGDEAAPLTTPTYHALRVSPYPPPDALQALKAANRRLSVPVGALGDLFHRAGLHTAVMGNLDTNVHDRSHYLLAMDSKGGVDVAGKPLLRKLLDETAPYGLRADVPMLFSYYEDARQQAALRVITFGDLYRADRYEALSLPEIAAPHRAQALASFNTFLSGLRDRIRAEQSAIIPVYLVLLAPGPPESSPTFADRFAPILVWGSGVMPGALTSATTHRTGLVSNIDLVATVADWLHQPLSTPTAGHPFLVTPRPVPTPESLVADHNNLVQEAALPNILSGFPTLFVLFALTLLLLLARYYQPRSAPSAAVALVALPLGLLLLPMFRLSNAVWAGISLAVFTLLVALPAFWLPPQRALRYYLILLGILLLTLVIGALTGAHLWQDAWITPSITTDPTRSALCVTFGLVIWIGAGRGLNHLAQKADHALQA